jgi:hypothetical protein
MSVSHSPPKRKPNKNQTSKTASLMEDPISSVDESNENTASELDGRNQPGSSNQNPTVNKSMQANINQGALSLDSMRSSLSGQTLQPMVSRIDAMEDTMNTLLDKFNEIISRMLVKEPEVTRSTKKKSLRNGRESASHPNSDETDYSVDDEAAGLDRQNRGKQQQAPVSIQNKEANQLSSAFTPYSRSEGSINISSCRPPAENAWINENVQNRRSNPSVVSHGSVERELRHVHFHTSSNTRQRSSFLNTNIPPSHVASNTIQPPDRPIPYFIRVKIG